MESFFKENHDGSVYELLCSMTGNKDIIINNLPEDNKGTEAYYIYIKKIMVKITTVFLYKYVAICCKIYYNNIYKK